MQKENYTHDSSFRTTLFYESLANKNASFE